MFAIRAAFDEQVEWRTSAERAREFFSDLRNYAELMPGVERITADALGVARWPIRAEARVVGSLRQAFSVFQAVDPPSGIECSPAAAESKNSLRCSATSVRRAASAVRRI